MIEIHKHNESFLKLTGDFEDLNIISQAFTRFAPNYFWSPKYKAGIWDGKIRFFNSLTGLLPQGLEFMLNDVIKENKIQVASDHHNLFNIPISIDTKLFASILKDFEKFTPHQHQLLGVKRAIEKRKGLLEHATASGKTATLFFIIKYLMANSMDALTRIAVVVPSIDLIQQFVSDFDFYGMDSDKYIGKYYGKEKDLSKLITVGTWQSLCKIPSFLSTIGIVIADEVHSAKAIEVKGLFEHCTNASIRIGLTGSLPKEECDLLTIIGNFGPILHKIRTDDLIKLGIVAPIEVTQLKFFYPTKVKKYCKDDYGLEKEVIQKDRRRMLMVKKLINLQSWEDNLLLLFNELEFGKRYYEFLKNEIPGRKFYYVDGNVDVNIRGEIRKYAQDNEGVVIVASLGTFSVGINIPRLHAIIGLWLGKSDIRIKQSIGRGIRLHATKDKLTFYDIADQLKYSKQHSRERLGVYKAEGFPVKTVEIGKGL